MEPEKAKSAIVVTIIIAAIIVVACVGAILYINDVFDFESDAEETDTVEDGEEGAAAAEVAAVPSEADLKGTSENLQHPKSSNYLPAYEQMSVDVVTGGTTNLLYVQEPPEYTWDIIAKLPDNTVVTALARENGYTLVRYKDGVVGWVATVDLDAG